MALDWTPLLSTLDQHQRFTITSHQRPDADAIGSAVALAGLLQRMGKLTRIIMPSEAPKYLKWLDAGQQLLKIGEQVSHEEALDTSCHIVVDTSAWAQLGEVGPVLRETTAEKIVIDHHLSSDDLGATEYKDTTASAAGVLVAELYRAADMQPTEEQAMALFCAIATDTGWFRFSSVEPRTLRVAADLVEAGARPSRIYRQLYERSSMARLKLQSRVLDRITLSADGRLAHSWVLRSDIDEVNAQQADTEGFVNQLLSLEGVDAAFLTVEQIDGRAKFSLRSQPGFEVASVAERFGGGGHAQACGVMIDGPATEAIETVREAVAGHLTSGDAVMETDKKTDRS